MTFAKSAAWAELAEANWFLQFEDNPSTFLGPYRNKKQAEFMQGNYKTLLNKETKVIQR